MKNRTNNFLLNDLEILTDLELKEAANVNGGFVSRQLGAALGNQGSAWWYRNFWNAANRGNISGAIGVTDRYVGGLVNSLRRFGIAVPNYPF